MTVATTVLGLLPLLWEAGGGADVSARTAAPVIWGVVVLHVADPARPCLAHARCGAGIKCASLRRCRC